MIERLVRGEVPAKHHIAFRDAAGALRWEECLTRDGFDGPYSILYHERRPHEAKVAPATHGWAAPVAAPMEMRRRHFKSQDHARIGGGPIDAHRTLLFNRDVAVHQVTPDAADPVWVANGDADDLYWIFEGSGSLHTPFGRIDFKQGDYVGVPKGVIHRFMPDEGTQTWLHFECFGGMGIPKQWRNGAGQIRMDAPFCHRDFRAPIFEGPQNHGVRDQVIKRNGQWHGLTHPHSPLDVVGWDGTVYPWAFHILDFQARAGLTHLPPRGTETLPPGAR